jgi:ribosomal protein S8
MRIDQIILDESYYDPMDDMFEKLKNNEIVIEVITNHATISKMSRNFTRRLLTEDSEFFIGLFKKMEQKVLVDMGRNTNTWRRIDEVLDFLDR